MERLIHVTPLAGRPWPLGASFDGHGVNFAVFSAHAQAIELCLFDATGIRELARHHLPAQTNDVWHGYLPDAAPGLLYGLRAYGPWRPDQGHRFDPSKLLLDPYAREIVGEFIWSGDQIITERDPLRRTNTHNNAALALKARVTDDHFDWGDDASPMITDTVLYECHVKGYSMLNPLIPPSLRGSYAGLAHPASINYLKQLGVTSVSLLPVHYSLSEDRLIGMGLCNYWGYNTIGFFCVNPRLASGSRGMSARDEFRGMVRALHAAGLEVILDVVYNHTAESGETGPTISFRGLDNANYYRLQANDLAHYENLSGCGNTLDVRQPVVLQLVMDSLRYWVTDMHVDGFRFDLASILGRTDSGFSPQGAFFTAVAQDPVLSHVRMISEPWDLGPGGYQVGGFPRHWHEWNDKFRDGMRKFWVQAAASGHSGTCGEFAMRLCGSSDVFQQRRRVPSKSINYVVSHDGFTLRDLVSYNERHNQANGENNRDGQGENHNFNCGVEGPTADTAVNSLRTRLQRAMLASTLLSQGTPMLCAGDEIGHTQDGNNNPYCQDNATTWIKWEAMDKDLLAFTQHVMQIRRQSLPFANLWYSGLSDADGVYDLSWLNPNGSALQADAWQNPGIHAMACLIGKPGRSKSPLLWLINAGHDTRPFVLARGQWQVMLDTSLPQGKIDRLCSGGSLFTVKAHSLILLQQTGTRPLTR